MLPLDCVMDSVEMYVYTMYCISLFSLASLLLSLTCDLE